MDRSSYLVEAYAPRLSAAQLATSAERARVAAAELTHEGTPVTYGRTIYLPVDETCFYLFEAASLAAVEAVTARAELAVQRIARAVEHQ